MRAQVLGNLAVIGIYHTSILWRCRRLWVEDGVLLRRQFLRMSTRGGRYCGKPFVQNAEMYGRRVQRFLFETSYCDTYARSRFMRRMFFLANSSLKYSLSLSCKSR